MTLFYCPLEGYKERYTSQLDQWMQKAFTDSTETDIIRVIGPSSGLAQEQITTGQVLDVQRRIEWTTSQVNQLVSLMANGYVKPDDKILLMDFWHSGLDGLFYALHQYGLNSVEVSAFCWAQSVDQYDFTHAMKSWMRPVEQGYGKRFSQVFVADEGLRELLVAAGVCPDFKVAVVGLPFDSKAVQDIHTSSDRIMWDAYAKDQTVVFSSRFDAEKDPEFFIQVARTWKLTHENSPVKFVMCTSADEIRSNNPHIKQAILTAQSQGIISVYIGLTKTAYYRILRNSMVQFNCSLQDWVSFTLLEAVTFGCYPIYPMRRSFPGALGHEPLFLYRPDDVQDAIRRIKFALGAEVFYTQEAIEARQDLILTQHDGAIGMMMNELGLTDVIPDMPTYLKWTEWRNSRQFAF